MAVLRRMYIGLQVSPNGRSTAHIYWAAGEPEWPFYGAYILGCR